MDLNFDNLKKIPAEPAARMLAMANMKLETKVQSPPSAPVDVVLQELADKEAPFDILTLLSVALPPREAIWWACLAGRDLVDKEEEKLPPPLSASEAWVFKPNDENPHKCACRDGNCRYGRRHRVLCHGRLLLRRQFGAGRSVRDSGAAKCIARSCYQHEHDVTCRHRRSDGNSHRNVDRAGA